MDVYDDNLVRFRVKVSDPPCRPHCGFILWGVSAAAAKKRAFLKGFDVVSVEEEELSLETTEQYTPSGYAE